MNWTAADDLVGVPSASVRNDVHPHTEFPVK